MQRIFALIVLCLLSGQAAADIVSSDKKVVAGAMRFNGIVHAILPEPDGGMLVGGEFSSVQNKTVPALVRMRPDGNLDAGFGTMQTKLSGVVRDIVRLPDGRILVAGKGLRTAASGHPESTVMLRSDGSIDPAFRSPVAASREITRAYLLPTGGIALLSDRGFTRLMSDNRVYTFGAVLPEGTIAATALAPDGRLLIALNDHSGWHLERWTADGEIDRSFTSSIDLPGRAQMGGFGIRLGREDGRIVIKGFLLGDRTNVQNGLRSKDVLISVRERGVLLQQDLDLPDKTPVYTGKPGSLVTFTVERTDEKGVPSQQSISFRRQPLTELEGPARPRGREGAPSTALAFLEEGKMVVAREDGEQVRIIRLLAGGQADKGYNRVPRVLPPDELDTLHNDMVGIIEGDAPEPETVLFTEAWRRDRNGPPSVVALVPLNKGRMLVGLSDGHVLRLEQDGSLDETYHLRVEDSLHHVVLLPDGSALIHHRIEYRTEKDPFTGDVLFRVDNNGKPIRGISLR